VRARRSVVRWDDARAGAVGEHLAAVAREAAMQSRRARIPVVAPVADLADLAGRPGIVVASQQGGPATAIPVPPGGTWTVVIGPEGGFEPGEIEALAPVGLLALSPHVLRARTAPVAAAAVLVARGLRGLSGACDAPITLCESPWEA
jgi:16S rRNA (uracil1498-N3)-methyltransferase